MKLDFKETRKMLAYDLQRLCIEKDWYTLGDNVQYEKLLSRVDSIKNLTTADVISIAMDIIHNSENMNIDDDIDSVCFELFEICHTFIEKV